MSGYKVVPVEPTEEMLNAPLQGGRFENRVDLRSSIYRAMLAAAPAVQGEPAMVAWVLFDATADQKYIKMNDRDGSLAFFDSEAVAQRAKHLAPGTDYKRCEYYTAPQTVEQPECGCCGQTVRCDDDCDAVVLRKMDQNPAPDASVPAAKFKLGDHVRKTKGSQWKGRVVGTYSTTLTPEGYAVESDTEKGSVQIYPVGALELVGEDVGPDVKALAEALEAVMFFHTEVKPNDVNLMTHYSEMLSKVRGALDAYHKQQEPSHDNQ